MQSTEVAVGFTVCHAGEKEQWLPQTSLPLVPDVAGNASSNGETRGLAPGRPRDDSHNDTRAQYVLVPGGGPHE